MSSCWPHSITTVLGQVDLFFGIATELLPRKSSSLYDDDFPLYHVDERVDNFLHRNSRRHTAPLTLTSRNNGHYSQLNNKSTRQRRN
ncbi:hypothetical protein TNCV_3349041 [Trichonephila clavipes]|nr:hypothetical protein TNCV_3349041 [Trichonephila clavipes]